MKKIIILLITLLCFTGCVKKGTHYTTNNDEIGIKYITDKSLGYEIVEITYRDETHEYLIYNSGHSTSVSHWEGCKYCKENK